MPADVDFNLRVASLERRLRAAILAAVAAFVTGIIAVAVAVTADRVGGRADGEIVETLRVRSLDVIDGNGVTRVKLQAPLPPPVIAGQKLKTRGGGAQDTLSGILLFDADGAERSGYATVDRGYSNVLMTLDDKRSRQHALFITEPDGGTTLRVFNAETQDRVDVAVDEDGPSITMVRRGKEIYRQPARDNLAAD